MEVPGPDSDWRSPQFRQKVVAQIEEAMRKAGTAHTKSSNDMENHVYVKAKSREEYLSLVARLIIHFRDIHKKTLGGPDPMNALTNLTGVGGGPGAIGMGPRPTGAPVGGMGAMGPMQIGQHAMAGVAGNPQAIGGPGQMPIQQMVQAQQQQQQQQQSIQFQQFQQAQQQQQQQNVAIQQQFQVQQQQLRAQQLQQQHHQNQQLQQQHQNQQQAQNQQQQNQRESNSRPSCLSWVKRGAPATHTKNDDIIARILELDEERSSQENETLPRSSDVNSDDEDGESSDDDKDDDEDDDDDSFLTDLLRAKIVTLEKENQKLRRENDQFRTTFGLFEKLPHLLEKVESLFGTLEGVQLPSSSAKPADTSPKQIDIGGGVFVAESSLRYCDHSQYRKLTSGLLTLLFTKEELAQSSLSGKKCNIQKTNPKQALDIKKLEAIVGYVVEKCGCNKKDVLKIVKAKLNYEDKALKRPKPKKQ